jgi:hypothetical protein
VRGIFDLDDLFSLQYHSYLSSSPFFSLLSFAEPRAKAFSEVTARTDGIFSELILQKAHLGACRIGRRGALFYSPFEED